MLYEKLILIIRARWVLALAVAFAVLVTVAVVSLILPRQYEATAAVVIDVKSPDPIAGMVLQGMMAPGYMATQVDVINSERVARRVIQELKLASVAEIRQQWEDATGGRGDFNAWLAELLQKKLTVRPSRESSVLNVSYVAADPAFAAGIANAFVKAYIETTLELRVQPARQYSNLFDEQAANLRRQLEAAQSKLSEHQKKSGLMATDERFDVENTRLNELSSQLAMVQSMAADARGRQAVLTDSSQEVVTNALITTLKAQKAQAEAKLKEFEVRFGQNHPQVMELRGVVQELTQRIATETSSVKRSVVSNDMALRSREVMLRQALEEQRKKVLAMKVQRDLANVLQRDVENAQRAYDAIVSRLNISSLESQSNQTNVSVLKIATPPADPKFPNTTLNIILGVFLGSLLGVASAFAAEMLNRKLRSSHDVTEVLQSHVLASIKDSTKRIEGRSITQTISLPPAISSRLALKGPTQNGAA